MNVHPLLLACLISVLIGDAWVVVDSGVSNFSPGSELHVCTSSPPQNGVQASPDTAARCDDQIHTTMNEGGMMQMVRLDALPFPKDGDTTLAPGGYHLMLMDIAEPLRPGTSVMMTLTFEDAGERVVEFPVRDARAASE